MAVSYSSTITTDLNTLASNIENLILLGTSNINGTGNSLSNVITGNGANNVLDGGSAGADALNGGLGKDTYIVDRSNVKVTELLNQGIDLVQSSIDYTLGANVENLTLIGAALIGKGNALTNVITGNSFANLIYSGGGGNDTLIGGADDDTYFITNTGVKIVELSGEGSDDEIYSTVSCTVDNEVEYLTLMGSANINGVAGAATHMIIGNSVNNVLDGTNRPTVSLVGLAGNDTYIVSHTGISIGEVAAQGTDLVKSSISYTLANNIELENLTLTGTTAINAIGNTLSNIITGNSIANIIDGGTIGNDTIIGGKGNDTYLVSHSGVIVKENLSEGIDLVQSIVDFTLGANVENLTLAGSATKAAGNSQTNVITGTDLSNIISSGGGNDTLIGGAGNDTYVMTNTGVIITENSGEGADIVESTVSFTLGNNIENLTLLGSAVNGVGNTLVNIITGNNKNNLLNSGTGTTADTLIGGIGNDTYIIDSSNVVIKENTGEGTDTVISAINYTMGGTIESLILTGSATIGEGNSLSNYIKANSLSSTLSGGLYGNNTLYGGIGNDSLASNLSSSNNYIYGGAGNDSICFHNNTGNNTVITGAGDDYIYFGSQSGNNYIDAGDGNDILTTFNFCTGNNTIIGGKGDDDLTPGSHTGNLYIVGGEGNDTIGLDSNVGGFLSYSTLIGGVGDDVYYAFSNTAFVENAGEGYDIIRSGAASITMSPNIEDLYMVVTACITAIGNQSSNLIVGNRNINILNAGSAGRDTLQGGQGADTYIVDHSGVIVQDANYADTDLVLSSVSFSLTDYVENLTLTGSGNINGTGNTLLNIITGNSKNNIIIAGTGTTADTLIGGLGNDTYIIESSNVVVKENAGEGTDLVKSTISYTLANSIELESLTITGTAFVACGNTLSNIITGSSIGNMIYTGGAGNDTLVGGKGNDSYFVDHTGVVIKELLNEGIDYVASNCSYTLSANVENLELFNPGAPVIGYGNLLSNLIIGNTLANIIYSGGGGKDTLIGANGNDTYVVTNTGVIVDETLYSGTDIVESSVSFTLGVGVENLTLTRGASIGKGNTVMNIITGNSLSNIINDGGTAVQGDTLIGGKGNDSYIMENNNDNIIENLGEGTDIAISYFNYTLAANIENLTLAGAVATIAVGNSLNNVITGNTLANIIDAGTAGADVLKGGKGNDTYIIDHSGVSVIEVAVQGTDLVQSGVDYTLGLNLENLTLIGVTAIKASGNNISNLITGNSLANIIYSGTAGKDTLVGGTGADTYLIDHTGVTIIENGGEGVDHIETTVSFTMSSNIEDMILTGTAAINGIGNSGQNIITGNSKNNILNAGTAGVDHLTGGKGNDTYIIDHSSVNITENAGEGTDLVQINLNYTLGSDLENLTLTGTALTAEGNTLSNIIIGNTSDNFINGGTEGKDTLIGGKGNDAYLVNHTGIIIKELLNEGTDSVISNVDFTLLNNIENLSLNNAGSPIIAAGNSLTNSISGNSLSNIIYSGGGGLDNLYGNKGNDTYVITNTGVTCQEIVGEGTDLVESTVSYTMNNEIENLTLTGTSAINGIGTSLTNIITGNSLRNVLDGGTAGSDTLIGGKGNDTYIISHSGVTITENVSEGVDVVQTVFDCTLSNDIESLTLTGAAAIIGIGNSVTNVIIGNSLNNRIDAGTAGSDTLMGGLGNDTYTIDHTNVVVKEGSNEGTDLVSSSVDYTLGSNVENLTLTGTTAIIGTGSAVSNLITGNTLANILSAGSAGDDTLIGGIGDDTYLIDHTGVIVIENSGQGTDLIQSKVSYTLGNNIENLSLAIATKAVDGTGNSLTNYITGNIFTNVLDGGTAGADTLIGYSGNDTYMVGRTNITLVEAAGGGVADTVISSIAYTLGAELENLTYTGSSYVTLKGNSLSNKIIGSDSANVLNDGSGGVDTLIGGDGDDLYSIHSTSCKIIELDSEGSDSVLSTVTYTLGANLESLGLTGTENINGTGNSLTNFLDGNGYDNILNGGSAGDDTLNGEDGSDTYIVNHTGVYCHEQLLIGTDVVESSVSFTLDDSIENLTMTGSNSVIGEGNSNDNIITANNAGDTLVGGHGDDELIGGDGDDVYTFLIGDTMDSISSDSGGDNLVIFQDAQLLDIAIYAEGSQLFLDYDLLDRDMLTVNDYDSVNYVVFVGDTTGSFLTLNDINAIIDDISAYNIQHPGAINSAIDVRSAAATDIDSYSGLTLMQQIATHWTVSY